MSFTIHGHHCTIDVKPKPKGRPRFTRSGRTYTPADTLAYEKAIGEAWNGPCFEGNISVELTFLPEQVKVEIRPMVEGKAASRADVDNLIKSVLDGLQGHAFKNDSQVMHVRGTKAYK